MRLELQQIPPAPRQPRWPPVLWSRWPLALAAFLMAVYGGTVTLLFYCVWGGIAQDDLRLDRAAHHAAGEITAMHQVTTAPPRWHAYFRFTPQGQSAVDGEAYLGTPMAIGSPVEVEFLPGEEHVSRILGNRRSRFAGAEVPVWQRLWQWLMLPGFATLSVWWLGVLRARRLLRGGDVAVATITAITPVAYVVPSMLQVRFAFRDRRARVQHGQHWVRARSRLGMKLRQGPTQAPVVHDRDQPARCRLVTGDDFVPAPAQPSAANLDFTPHADP